MSQSDAPSQPELIRGVSLAGATTLNMIDMIGVGPFITIPLIVSAAGGPQAMLGWIAGAVFALCDGLVWAELGAAMPQAGGSYQYLKQIYGPNSLGRLLSFLFIWQLSFSAPLSIASGCIGLAHYAGYIWPGLEHSWFAHTFQSHVPLLGSMEVSIVAAGCLAIEYGILPWNCKKLLRAILSCQLDQLRFGNATKQQVQDGAAPPIGAPAGKTSSRAKLIQYLKDKESGFVDLNKHRLRYGVDNPDAVSGFREEIEGQVWLYLTASRFAEIVGSGDGAKTLKKELATEGMLEMDQNRFVVQRKVFEGGKGNKNYLRVHAFKGDLIASPA